MSLRNETPQETLRRLQGHEHAVVTPVSRDTAKTPHEKRHWRPDRGESRSTLRLVVTSLLGIGALLFGGVAAVQAAEMGIYGKAVTAEVLSVEAINEGTNRIYVQYPVDGVAQRSTIDERGNVSQPGQPMEVVYDIRDVTQVAEAPTAVDYVMITAFVGLGLFWIISAARGFRQRRGSQRLT